MSGREIWSALAAAGAGGAGESIFGAWAAAGAILRHRFWRCFVSADHRGARLSLYPYLHSRLYADRSRIPAGALEGYKAPLAKPGLFEHALSIVRTWTQDLRELEATLPKLAGVPTLFIWGDKDPAVFASSAAPLAKYFPNSKLIIFPDIGHLPYEECPEEFNRALIEFLTREKLSS